MRELVARDITAGYGIQDILQGVTLAVRTGELVGLIGPNGSGKSTLLRVLTGWIRPRKGEVTLEGKQLGGWGRREIAQRVALVPQQEPAPFDFTVREIVLMGRYARRQRNQGYTPEDYTAVARALAKLDILPLADRFVTQLSGGEHRRVLLARALAQEAPLLLLDEPTAHLDLLHQVELLTLLYRLTRSPEVGALVALHDLNQAAEFCDRLVLIAHGSVQIAGTPEQVLTSDNLRIAYRADVRIGRNPITERPGVLSVSPLSTDVSPLHFSVHVVAGGGSAVGLMTALVRRGIPVTAGVLNRLDVDAEATEALHIETALEAPFSPIGAEARQVAAEYMDRARLVIVAPVPFGAGNLANLELVVEAQRAGKEILLLGENSSAQDFTRGAAGALLRTLRDHGARSFARWEDAVDWLNDTQREGGSAPSLSSARDATVDAAPVQGANAYHE